jgi:hypothetical protein
MHLSAAGLSASLDVEKICKWESLDWGLSTAERKSTKIKGGDWDQEEKIGEGCRNYWDHQYTEPRIFDITADAR